MILNEEAKIGIFPFIGKTTAQKDEKTHILFVRIWAFPIEAEGCVIPSQIF